MTAYAGLPIGDEAVSADEAPVADEDLPEAESKAPSYAASLWAMLIARIYEVLDEIHPCISHYVQLSAAQIRSGRICPLVCPQCGGELKIVAFLTEADPIQRILICLWVNYNHTASNRACSRANRIGWERI